MIESNITYNTKDYTIKDYYISYINSIEGDGLPLVSYKVYRSIVEEYFKYLADSIIEYGERMLLPARTGELCVIKYKTNSDSLTYDYQASKKLGKPVWNFNDHSNGWKYRFYWYKKNLLINNCTKYQLVMTRTNKRRLAAIINNKERDYIEL